MKILHVLDHSLPYFSGYSFRSDSILRTQRQLGWQPIAITSPKHENFDNEIETINGVSYHRTHWPIASGLQNLPMARQIATVTTLAKQIIQLAEEFNPEVIHAHSPSLCGLAAAKAAKALNLPVVYELRYYEEDAAVDRGKTRHNSLRYRLGQRLEFEALQQADAVTTLSRGLRDDLIQRGISPEKIFIIPNGVDTTEFQSIEPDAELTIKHELAGKLVIGFIGSFYFYEGLETLIDAVLILLAQRNDAKLLLVGDGESADTLRQRVPESLREHFIFTGNVAHNEVRRYYSVMDVLAYPRVQSRLTELTTPLKPLEAMAMEKAVVASNIGGLRELLDDGNVGYLVEAGNKQAWADQLLRLLENPNERLVLAQRAREFVLEQRTWPSLVSQYLPIYQRISTL
ncbi:MAG: TIGR04063 family PEP-CTERM/XrtA system glycosyltransferase [Blastocatellia bacterium]